MNIKGPIESEMADAWGRRIARDWQSMPVPMQALFLVAFALSKARSFLSLLCGVGFCLTALWAIAESYTPIGGSLLTEHSLFAPAMFLAAGVMIFQWVLPIILNYTVQSWYHKARKQF